MHSNEIRKSFLEFFQNKQHQVIPSESVIANSEDKTLMFINAGMNPFKNIFLGLEKSSNKRIANSQKCIRISGKHNDLEEVGLDTYHHTFFEMLGNWSFGDYYKKEAILWAWQLLTEVWRLDPKRLFVSIYNDDDDAYQIWKDEVGVEEHRILRFGDKENFWEMAATGPCGPCSEIHYDKGDIVTQNETYRDEVLGVNGENDRYIEIWNLVFIQYNRDAKGELSPLKDKFIDTGMGFERITAVLQNKESNYDTDIFEELISAVESISGKKYSEKQNQVAIRVIVDHIRMVCFSIVDGEVPSNEGRGYVIRRVIRRAYRYGTTLGISAPFLHKMVSVLGEKLKQSYPNLYQEKERVAEVIFNEEKSFAATLEKGTELLKEILKDRLEKKQKIVTGKEAFTLYDTYGFPLDLTKLIVAENGFTVDENEFDEELQKQKQKSNANTQKKYDSHAINECLKELKTKTTYCGEEQQEVDGECIAIINEENQNVEKLSLGESGILVFDKTTFYGEGGGQVGDSGVIKNKDSNQDSEFIVEETKKISNFFLHIGKVSKNKIEKNQNYKLTFNSQKREEIKKNHSATHLLHLALTQVLGDSVAQKGSFLDDTKLRFDFNFNRAVSKQEIEKIENITNEMVFANLPVKINEMPLQESKELGAKSYFEEKYGDVVRVVNIGGESIELCGGSHVSSSSMIGGVKILFESSVSSGIRRIEAISGKELFNSYQQKFLILQSIKKTLHVDQEKEVLEKVANLVQKNKDNEKIIFEQQQSKQQQQLSEIKKIEINDSAFYGKVVNDFNQEVIKKFIDKIKNENPKSICFFANQSSDKVVFICGVTKDLIPKYNAGEFVKYAAKFCDGNGGGRNDFAQAGAKDISKVNFAFEKVLEKIKEI